MSVMFIREEFPYTFPIDFGLVFAVQVEDYDPVYFLQPAIDRQTSIASMPYFSFQADPGTLFEEIWLPATGQQMQEVLMPTYDERFIGGDIPNQPYFELQLFPNIHFGPDGTDDFQGPATFDILEGPATFELRTPE